MFNFSQSIPPARKLPKIPRLEDVSDTYATLVEKRTSLSRRLHEVNEEIRIKEAIILDRRRSRLQKPDRKEVPNERVAHLLGEDVPADVAKPLDQEIVQLRQEARDLQDAVNVLGERVATARMEASAVICQKIEPELRAIISELAGKMAEVSHLALTYRAVVQQLNAAEIAWSDLNPMGIRAGGVSEKGSQFALWLNAAAQRGYISPDLLPKEIAA